jgi:hypothetical protein
MSVMRALDDFGCGKGCCVTAEDAEDTTYKAS